MNCENKVEVVGFNGVPMSRVGLAVPIAEDPKRSGFFFKLGTLFRDEINLSMLVHFASEGRITKLPIPLKVNLEEARYQDSRRLTVGFVKERLLEDLQSIGSRSNEGLLRFDWQPNPDGQTGRLYTARLKQIESTETKEAEEVVKDLFLLPERRAVAKAWYWLGQSGEDSRMLAYWSDGLCQKFDSHWSEVKDQLLEVGENHEARVSILQPWEEILWQAIACDYTDKQRLLEPSFRLFACVAEYEAIEDMQKRYERGLKMLIPDIPWNKFYKKVVALRQQLGSLSLE